MGKVVSGRVAILCDGGNFEEIEGHSGSVYLCARAEAGGRPFLVVANDPEPPAGAPDLTGSLRSVLRCLDMARRGRWPVVWLFDAPAVYQSQQTAFQGADAQLLMGSQGVGRLYCELSRLTAEVLVLGAVFGPMAQAQAFPVAMCHAVVMTEDAALSVARPDAVKAMLGEEVSTAELGGARMHHRRTGICDHLAAGQDEALAWLRRLLGALAVEAPAADADPEAASLATVLPERLNQPFEARRAVAALVDRGSFVELGDGYANEVVVGLARLEGMAFGLAASNPASRGGVFFPETCRKLARFVRFVDVLGLPLVFLADAPGFMIGQDVEHAGIVAAGAELFEAIARRSIPSLCVVLRRAYTAGLYAMGGSGFGPARFVALPGADIAVYGAEAVERFMAGLALPPDREAEIRSRIEAERDLDNLCLRGLLDEVVRPDNLRREMARFVRGGQLQQAAAGKGRHGYRD